MRRPNEAAMQGTKAGWLAGGGGGWENRLSKILDGTNPLTGQGDCADTARLMKDSRAAVWVYHCTHMVHGSSDVDSLPH